MTLVTDETIAEAMLDDIGRGQAVPIGPIVRRGRPPGSRNRPKPLDEVTPAGPKSAPLSDDVTTPLPRRRGRPPKEPNVTPEQIADMIVMAHTVAGAMISPKAAISKEDAKKIGDAVVPVMNDFGVVIVGKVVHVVALLAAIVVVEGPIAFAVMQDARATAMAKRGNTATLSSVPQYDSQSTMAQEVAHQLGLEVGLPAS